MEYPLTHAEKYIHYELQNAPTLPGGIMSVTVELRENGHCTSCRKASLIAEFTVEGPDLSVTFAVDQVEHTTPAGWESLLGNEASAVIFKKGNFTCSAIILRAGKYPLAESSSTG